MAKRLTQDLVRDQLEELGFELPHVSQIQAVVKNTFRWARASRSGVVEFSGAVAKKPDDSVYTGRLGIEDENDPEYITLEEAQKAAENSAYQLLCQFHRVVGGDWDRFERILKLRSMTKSTDGFGGQPLVANGATNLFKEVLGLRGEHARCAFGTNSDPAETTFELEATVDINVEGLDLDTI
ncbi:RidA family protein [Alphaproteobacteria bacterium]|nr:RidA family protein [Alphaproteobacteria bacterium]